MKTNGIRRGDHVLEGLHSLGGLGVIGAQEGELKALRPSTHLLSYRDAQGRGLAEEFQAPEQVGEGGALGSG